jgi:hypothetical protein
VGSSCIGDQVLQGWVYPVCCQRDITGYRGDLVTFYEHCNSTYNLSLTRQANEKGSMISNIFVRIWLGE